MDVGVGVDGGNSPMFLALIEPVSGSGSFMVPFIALESSVGAC